MSRQRTDALVFDFDGVLIESTDIKTDAFAEIYRQYGDDVAGKAIAYHLEHAGISRYVKFHHLHQTLLGIRLSDAEVAKLGEQFSQLVLDAVVAAPWVRGAREFLESYNATLPLFVASGTPDQELKAIVARRGMERYFRAAHGAPASKGEIIGLIINAYGFEAERVLVVGDAATDLAGAQEAGARFIGRIHDAPNPFPSHITVIPDLLRLAEFL